MKKLLLALIALVALSTAGYATDVVYKFKPGTDGYSSYGLPEYKDGNADYVTNGSKAVNGAVTITLNGSAAEAWRMWSDGLRAYGKILTKQPTFTVSVDGGTITKITWNTKSKNAFALAEGTTGTLDATTTTPTWTGSANSVTIDYKLNSNGMAIETMTVTYEGSGKDAAGLKFPQAAYTANLGEAFTAPTLSRDTDAKPVYTSSKPEIATVDAATGAVTLVAAGETTITAETAETEDFNAGKASYTLTVIDPNVPGISLDNPMTVAQALAACADKPKNVYVTGIVKEVTTEYSTQYKNVTFTIVDSETDTEYLECYRAVWDSSVTASADNNPEVGATVIMYGNLTVYSSKKQMDAKGKIVKYVPLATPGAGLSFPQKSYTINLGETFTAPELTKATTADPVYTSSIPAVAEVDATTGAITVKTYGTTVITAATAATATHLAGKASYTLEVLNPAITLDAPLTVAQALAVCENDPHKVYVAGYVIAINTPFDSSYSNVSFTIADTKDGQDVLLCYRTKWDSSVTIPTEDKNPEVGAFVTVSGNLKVYSGTKEFDAGNLIVKYTGPSAVSDITADDSNAPVEYYNLQGVRVDSPANGLYIRRQGNTVTKVLVR